MKISATVCKKVGRPNYGSLGATCTVEADTQETDPGRLARAIRGLYAVATRAVEDQLDDQLGTPPRPAPAPDPEPGPDPDPEPARREPVGRNGVPLGRAATAGRGGGYDEDRPRDGRQFMAMLRRLVSEGEPDYQQTMSRWAKQQGLPWKFSEWGAADVAEALEYLGTVRRPAADVRQNGRNGR